MLQVYMALSPGEPLANGVEPCFVLAVLLIGDKQAIEIVKPEAKTMLGWPHGRIIGACRSC